MARIGQNPVHREESIMGNCLKAVRNEVRRNALPRTPHEHQKAVLNMIAAQELGLDLFNDFVVADTSRENDDYWRKIDATIA